MAGGVGAVRSMKVHAFQGPSVQATHAKNPVDDITQRSVISLARLIRKGQITSEEVVQAFLERIHEVNPKLNAVCQLAEEPAMHSARRADHLARRGEIKGPLHGVPITIKDSLDTQGIISTAGTLGRKDYLPKSDATVVARLRQAGAILLGKTNTPELTLGFNTDNLVYGRTNNPYNLRLTPGGSSGGAAAILAAGGSPLDIGSDTSGSLRVPSHFCGVLCLKPTEGRVSRQGHIISAGGPIGKRTVIGPMARYVEDLNLAYQLISGPDGLDPEINPVDLHDYREVDPQTLRVGWFSQIDRIGPKPIESIQAAVEAAVVALKGQVASMEEAQPQNLFDVMKDFTQLNDADGGDYYRTILEQCGTERVHRNTRNILNVMSYRKLSGSVYHSLLVELAKAKQSMLEFMKDYDILLCPVCSHPAPLHYSDDPMDFSFAFLFSLLGWPVVTVPMAFTSDGLPIGIQVAARPWMEHEALAIAALLEKSTREWKPAEIP